MKSYILLFIFFLLSQVSFQLDSNRIVRQKSMPFYSSKYFCSIDYVSIPKLPLKPKLPLRNITKTT